MDFDLVLPGHGDPVTDHRELIDERFGLHRRRAEKIHRLMDERPRTAYELAQAIWGNIAVTQAYLTLSARCWGTPTCCSTRAGCARSKTATSSTSRPSNRRRAAGLAFCPPLSLESAPPSRAPSS